MIRYPAAWFGLAVLCSLMLFVSCAWTEENALAKVEAPPSLAALHPHPEVTCRETTCEVRVAVTFRGRALHSRPLPFSASSPELASIPVDASFGLGQREERPLSAWAIGKEEHSIAVALEPIAIGDGLGVIAHQIAGYDHPKRSHVVMEIVEDGLKTHMEIVEGSGPDFIELWPVADGIALSRRQDDAKAEQIERYLWEGSGKMRSLVLLK